jgi:hypothetical protein
LGDWSFWGYFCCKCRTSRTEQSDQAASLSGADRNAKGTTDVDDFIVIHTAGHQVVDACWPVCRQALGYTHHGHKSSAGLYQVLLLGDLLPLFHQFWVHMSSGNQSDHLHLMCSLLLAHSLFILVYSPLSHQNLQDRHFRRRTPQCYCLTGGANMPTSAARDNNKPTLLTHSQVSVLPYNEILLPDNRQPTWLQSAAPPTLQNGIAYRMRGVGPMQLATQIPVSVGNNQ